MPQVCKFFLEGRCKFGDQCRFDHPRQPHAQDQGFHIRGQNRAQNNPGSSGRGGSSQQSGFNGPARGSNNFSDNTRQNSFGGQGRGSSAPSHSHNDASTFGGANARNQRSGQQGASQGARDAQLPDYGVTRQTIEDDLRRERPMWIMSAYGPGKDAPLQLFGGYPLEQSPEEIRTKHYLAVATGNNAQSAQMEQELAQLANQQTQNALRNLDAAVKYIKDGVNQHPNRHDIVRAGSEYANTVVPTAGPIDFPPGAFMAFPPTQQSTYTAPSTFQQQQQQQQSHASLQPTFVQPRQAFDQTPVMPFDQPTNSALTFGIARPAISQPLQQPMNPTMSSFVQQAPTGTHFHTPDSSNNVLTSGSGVGANQPSTFGASFGNADGGFSKQDPANQQSPLIGQPSFNSAGVSNSFGNGAGAPMIDGSAIAQLTNQAGANAGMHDPGNVGSYTQKGSAGQLLSWKGRPVEYTDAKPCYRNSSGSQVRIWFPEGQPNMDWSKHNLGNIAYDAKTEEAWGYFQKQGQFKDGIMPDEPPAPRMNRWDL